MIPARSINGEHVGIEVRYRVAACRKRLRDYRTTHKSPTPVPMDEPLSEIDPGAGRAGGDMSRSFEQEEGER